MPTTGIPEEPQNLNEIWEAQDENGKLIALEIKAASGAQSIVQFLQ